MKKKQWVIKKIVGMIILIPLCIGLLTFVVMSLWNGILVPVLNINAVTFWQALGIFVLSKILFGGFRGGRGGGCGGKRGGPPWKKDVFEKWQHMTPEERDSFKNEWRNRCTSWKRKKETDPETENPL